MGGDCVDRLEDWLHGREPDAPGRDDGQGLDADYDEGRRV